MPTLGPVPLPDWSKTKTTSKKGFDTAWHWVDKLGAPVNKLSNKIGSEAFWPTTLDKESDKAARILRSFCKDGFYDEQDVPKTAESPKGKQRVVKKIPADVIRKAKGLAIFTTMRTGLWVSGAGGSGVLIGRTSTGDWSPPSGILLHTAGLGFLVGVDIYDCVVVINTDEAMKAFTKIRCTLGGEVSAVAGPVGIGGILETEIHKRQAPVWTYLKSRGFYAGVQVDGTIIIERTDENARFYGEKIPVANILAGKVRHPPYELKMLMETIRAAQGDRDVDEDALPNAEPTPGDLEVERMDDTNGFGLPSVDDPDPFGVHALEKEGLEIREAGTRSRPSSDVFEYKPSPTSPIFSTFGRRSIDSVSRRNSKRESKMSIASTDRSTQTPDLGTSTIKELPLGANDHSPAKKTSEDLSEFLNGDDQSHFEKEPDLSSPQMEGDPQASIIPVIARARLVEIPKRVPPALPPRSPYRSLESVPDGTKSSPSPSRTTRDQAISSNFSSPSKSSFDEGSLAKPEYSNGFMTSMHERVDESEEIFPKTLEAPREKAINETDEFHSLPTTPIDPQPLETSGQEDLKRDFL